MKYKKLLALLFILLVSVSAQSQEVPIWIIVHDVSGSIILAEDGSTLLFDSDLGNHFLLNDYSNFSSGDRVHITGATYYQLYQETHYGEIYYNFDVESISGTNCRKLNNCCLGIRGNIDFSDDEIITISDIVFLVNHMFGTPTGDAPSCFEEADLDNSIEIDISDLVVIVEYTFAQTGIQLESCPDIPSQIIFQEPSFENSTITLNFMPDGIISGLAETDDGDFEFDGIYNNSSVYFVIESDFIDDWGLIVTGTICNDSLHIYETVNQIGWFPGPHLQIPIQ